MSLIIKNGTCYVEGTLKEKNIYMDSNGNGVLIDEIDLDEEVLDASQLIIIPLLLSDKLNKKQIEECSKDWKVATLQQCLDHEIDIQQVEIITSDIPAEQAFSLLYTEFVKEDKLALEDLIDCMSYNIACACNWKSGEIENFEPVNIQIIAPMMREKINQENYYGYDTSCHFAYCLFLCKIEDGIIVYRKNC